MKIFLSGISISETGWTSKNSPKRRGFIRFSKKYLPKKEFARKVFLFYLIITTQTADIMIRVYSVLNEDGRQNE